MPRTRIVLLAVVISLAPGARGRAVPPDPVAREIERWSAFLKAGTATDELWTQGKGACEPVLERGAEAAREGRRLLALQRLAAVRGDLGALAFLSERSAEDRKSAAFFEAEWARTGAALQKELAPLSGSALDGVSPALVRALGEVALRHVRGLYEASLEYGRNTMPEVGLYYIGSARSQRDFAAFCRGLTPDGGAGAAPALRSFSGELDALEAELLEAYRPPASIDRHPEFILVSSLLKEARELDAAGLRYGALLRLLQAAQRFAPVRTSRKPVAETADEARVRLKGIEARLSGSVDHSLGRLFVEIAEADLADAATSADGAAKTANALAIATDVLPRYLAALEPAPQRKPKAPASVTVTLVRWPYT